MVMTTDARVQPLNRPPRRRLRRWLGILLCACLGMTAAAYAFVRWAGPSAIVSAPNHGRVIDFADDPSPPALGDIGVDQHLRIAVGPPDASLSVWIIEPRFDDGRSGAKPSATIIILHGIRDGKRSMIGLGRRFAGAGFRCILPDLRGHGESSGDWLTYGVVESRDLSQLIDALARKGLIAGRIGVLGVSYGGATALMLAGRDARIDAVVAIAPFRSMQEVVPGYVRHYLPVRSLLPAGWIDDTIQKGADLAGFDPDDASPIDWVKRSSAHVLLIHGRRDDKIPPSHSRLLHAAMLNRSQLILLAAEDHDSVTDDRTGTIAREGARWFKRYLAPDVLPNR